MLKIYNTLSGRKESFRSITPGQVRMYSCGITVYDRCHLGHARNAIVFDVLRRYFEFKGYRVEYVRNFTDVDDKIINRAHEESRTWKAIAETYIEVYQEDMKRLRVRSADQEPKATDYINEMVDSIADLVKHEYAYIVDGDVFYRVKRFKRYGRLSKRNPEDLQSGARVEVDERKEDPLDFALWKSSKPGEPAWKSPWGPGRPGWHIECSVMSVSLFGMPFDIHCGGKDLIFPHHENEIAQSEATSGKQFVCTWVHNGFVTIDHVKMSKSLGNFFTIQEIFEKSPWPENITAEVLRYLLLSTHYRSPVDWSDAALLAAKGGVDNFYNLFVLLGETTSGVSASDRQANALLKRFRGLFTKAMDDDFNSASAIGEFQRLRADLNRLIEKGISKKTADLALSIFKEIGNVLGLFQLDPSSWIVGKGGSTLSHSEIEKLVKEREEARISKDWVRADAIRKRMEESGVILEDRPDGTTRVKQ